MEINTLIIEVTRKCQLDCIHCLRGKSQSMVLSSESMENLLSGVTWISSVTFTGGEPFLHPEVIDHFTSICEKNDIHVGSFYIATNGIIFSEKSKLASRGLTAIINLYNLCSDNEYSMIKVSKDEYHYTDNAAGMLLKAFSFVSFDDYAGYIIMEGNALDNIDPSLGKIKKPDANEIPVDFYDSILYLSCNNKVVFDCDISFERIDEEGISIEEGKKIIKELWEKENEL